MTSAPLFTIQSVEFCWKISNPVLKALFELFLFGGLLSCGLNLIRELKLRACREVLHVVGEVVRRRQRLPADGRLTSGQEGT